MSAMKAIYTDIQELQIAAMGDEDSFIAYIEEMGWKSPTEVEIQRRRERAGVKLPAIHSNGISTQAPTRKEASLVV